MTTNARGALLARWYDPKLDKDAAIAAIEAEKEAEVRARLAEEVEALADRLGRRYQAVGQDWPKPYGWVPTAAVLAVIQPEGAKA